MLQQIFRPLWPQPARHPNPDWRKVSLQKVLEQDLHEGARLIPAHSGLMHLIFTGKSGSTTTQLHQDLTARDCAAYDPTGKVVDRLRTQRLKSQFAIALGAVVGVAGLALLREPVLSAGQHLVQQGIQPLLDISLGHAVKGR